jgi:VIT1/CCC1 family predicted Fe2+/Mn2+ transporter
MATVLEPRSRLRAPFLPVGRTQSCAREVNHRDRIARLSRIRELVFGGQDGLLSTLGILTGLAGAAVGTTPIVVAGIATAAAGALSMGTGAWLASRAENQLFAGEIEREECAFCDRPDLASRELAVLLREEGLGEQDARVVAECLCTSRDAAVKTMVEKRLGLTYGDVETAWGDAGVVAASFVAGALVPLAPYLVLDVDLAVPVSVAMTGAALFALGVLKGKVARLAPLRSGLEVLLVGGLAAGLGYLIGSLAQLG